MRETTRDGRETVVVRLITQRLPECLGRDARVRDDQAGAVCGCTSRAVPDNIARQFSQVLSGTEVGPFTQLMQRARILAAEVLPEPRGPEKR